MKVVIGADGHISYTTKPAETDEQFWMRHLVLLEMLVAYESYKEAGLSDRCVRAGVYPGRSPA